MLEVNAGYKYCDSSDWQILLILPPHVEMLKITRECGEWIKMTQYETLQSQLLQYRNNQEQYWQKLISEINHFTSDLIDYLEVRTIILTNQKTGREDINVVLFGDKVSDKFEIKPPAQLRKDTSNPQQQLLLFAVQISLSKSGSSICDIQRIFELTLHRESRCYYVTFTSDNQNIICQEMNGKVDFTPVFDEIVNRYTNYINPSLFS